MWFIEKFNASVNKKGIPAYRELQEVVNLNDYFNTKQKGEKLLEKSDLEDDKKAIKRNLTNTDCLTDIVTWDFSNKTRYLRRLIVTIFFLLSLAYISICYGEGAILYGVEISTSSIGPLNVFLTTWICCSLFLYILSFLKDLWSRYALVGVLEFNLKNVGVIVKKWRNDMVKRKCRIKESTLYLDGNATDTLNREILQFLNTEEAYRLNVKNVSLFDRFLMVLDFFFPIILGFISVYLLQITVNLMK